MFTDEQINKRLRLVQRFFDRKSDAEKAEILKEVENRVKNHAKQKAEAVMVDATSTSGKLFFGESPLPRCVEEPERLESLYVIGKTTARGGEQRYLTVTLRVWEGWNCRESIDRNILMCTKACEDAKLSFGVRAQTEVMSRSVLMWLRLRGNFFWNRNNKTNTGNLYFDGDSQVLRVIHSDEFKGWLHAHTQISPAGHDFDVLMEKIDAASMNPEIASEVTPGALFDRRGDVVYISNGDSEMVKVSPAVDGQPVIQIVKNGTDNVVFMSGMTLDKWQIVDGEGEDPFETCPPFSTANYQSQHGRMIARLWFLGLASCLRSYPAIVFTGKMRSGKSRTAKAVFELLGAPVRLSAIREHGESDFWTVLNRGGVVCFDNVDSRNTWFGDAMQLACTDGSTESRTLYTNAETTTLRANAKIIMTSNNPMFASESGLADRLQIVRLSQFDGNNGKESSDSAITDAIASKRDAAMTWFARTVSKALADKRPVESNVNMRHPDFAAFAMRCARSLSDADYEASIQALKSAEFDKALLTIQNNTTMNYVLEVLTNHFSLGRNGKEWEVTAGQIMSEIVSAHPDLERSKYISATTIGRSIGKYYDLLTVLFVTRPPRKSGNATYYTFVCPSDLYAKNAMIYTESDNKSEKEEQDEIDDIL